MTLSLRLRVSDDGSKLISEWTNTGASPLAVTQWWVRKLVVSRSGAVVQPQGGPVLPCGVAEEWKVLGPGESFERDESLACTQPAGGPESVGWSYEHLDGAFDVKLVVEAPPSHGFVQAEPHPNAFAGRAESNSVAFTFKPPKPRGFLSFLTGR